MRRLAADVDPATLIARVHPKYKPVWDARPSTEQGALALYFLPHRSQKEVLGPTRPRLIKWYCPFAPQCDFPSGHRYCINVYTGCTHGCAYCYARAYEPACAAPKRDFAKLLAQDLEDLERFNVPPAPVHLSNSTDAFQPLEATTGHTRRALEGVLQQRHRFTTVTILTKNPQLPVALGFLDLFAALANWPSTHKRHAAPAHAGQPAFVVEVSLAFWRPAAAAAYDPGAPSVADRIDGLRALHAAGIPLVLRIDPLFPRSPLPTCPPTTLQDFDVPEAQRHEDLEQLVRLAQELQVRHVVYSPLKLVQPRGRQLSPMLQAWRRVYAACASPERPRFRGGSWRLPERVAQAHIVRPFLDLCARYGVRAKYCKQNLIETP